MYEYDIWLRHSVSMTVWCAGLDETHPLHPLWYNVYMHYTIDVQVWMILIQTCTPNGHLHRMTYTRCRTDTINSPDDRHMAARNM